MPNNREKIKRGNKRVPSTAAGSYFILKAIWIWSLFGRNAWLATAIRMLKMLQKTQPSHIEIYTVLVVVWEECVVGDSVKNDGDVAGTTAAPHQNIKCIGRRLGGMRG